MWKYIGWVIKVVPRVIFDYFAWIRRYARRPERYPLEVRYAKVRAFCLRLCRKLGVKVNVVNRPIQDRSEVRYYICNHVGFFDPIVLIATSREPIFFVAKKESKKMPFVGKILKCIDGVFIDRGNLRQEIQAMKVLRNRLADKKGHVCIYPEGTRNKSYTAPLADFKPGGFKPAISNLTPIYPIVIWGTQFILQSKFHLKGGYNVLLVFLPEISLTPEDDTIAIAEKSQKIMQDEVNALRNYYYDVYLRNDKRNRVGKFISN